MRRKLPSGALGLLTLLGVLAAAGVTESTAEDHVPGEAATPEYAPDSNFPEPVIESLSRPLDVPGTSLSLRPPGSGISAAVISGAAAVEIAEREFGPSAFPKQVVASLAQEAADSRLVWAVSFKGLCVPLFGPPGNTDLDCAGDELVVILDATTGQVDGLVSYR